MEFGFVFGLCLGFWFWLGFSFGLSLSFGLVLGWSLGLRSSLDYGLSSVLRFFVLLFEFGFVVWFCSLSLSLV